MPERSFAVGDKVVTTREWRLPHQPGTVTALEVGGRVYVEYVVVMVYRSGTWTPIVEAIPTRYLRHADEPVQDR